MKVTIDEVRDMLLDAVNEALPAAVIMKEEHRAAVGYGIGILHALMAQKLKDRASQESKGEDLASR